MCVFTVYFGTVSAFALKVVQKCYLPLHFIGRKGCYVPIFLEISMVIQVLYFAYIQCIVIP
jgi:hypothetical protein